MKRQVGIQRLQRRIYPVLSSLALTGLMSSPLVQAGYDNGGFEQGDLSHWVTQSYNRKSANSSQTGLDVFPPTTFSELTLTPEGSAGGGLGDSSSNRVAVLASPNLSQAPNLSAPRWGDYVVQIGGSGGRKASSIEQTATMGVADVDPADGKVHIRFALAPVLNNPGHKKENQPFFFVEINNKTKGTQLFRTFNFSNQAGIPWQNNGNIQYTDWQGFDIAPGNGLLDVGDEVELKVSTSNCSEGASSHTAVVYMDAVGAFMPGLTVAATGPTSTKPGEQLTYSYSYINNSGALALDSKVHVAVPITEGQENARVHTSFGAPSSYPANCVGDSNKANAPFSGADGRGDFIVCSVGDLGVGQGGSFDVTFELPNTAPTAPPYNVVNNGDYNISANTVSPFNGPLVQTDILDAATELLDLAVTIGNGGILSYAPGETANYTMTFSNLGQAGADGFLSQSISGLGNDCSALTFTPNYGSCVIDGAGLKVTFPAQTIATGDSIYYQLSAEVQPLGPVNVVASVTPSSGTDSNTANNIAGMNTPVGNQFNALVKAEGAGSGQVLAVPGGLSCGSSTEACEANGTSALVADNVELRLTPVAHSGSIFLGWSQDSSCVDLNESLCVIEVKAEDVQATAKFALAWLVEGNLGHNAAKGSFVPATVQQIVDGELSVFEITADPGYVPYLESSSCPGVGLEPGQPYRYTVGPVLADCEFMIGFTDTDIVNVTATVIGANGQIVPPGNTTLLKGSDITYQAIPEQGYVPVFGGTCSGTATGQSFTANQVQEDCEVKLSFVEAAESYVVTSLVEGAGGSINISGPINVPAGETRVYTLSPDAGFAAQISQSSCPAELQAGQSYSYTVGPVDADCDFIASFTDNTVQVSAEVIAGNGSINPAGSSTIALGGDIRFTATPAANELAVFSGSCSGQATVNTFTAQAVQEDCVLQVEFINLAQVDLVHTVSSTVIGDNGSIDVTGELYVAHNGSRDYRFSAEPGLIPYLSGTCPAAVNGGLITVGPVTQDCDLVVKFGRVAAVPVNNPFMLLLLALAVLGLVARQRSLQL